APGGAARRRGVRAARGRGVVLLPRARPFGRAVDGRRPGGAGRGGGGALGALPRLRPDRDGRLLDGRRGRRTTRGGAAAGLRGGRGRRGERARAVVLPGHGADAAAALGGDAAARAGGRAVRPEDPHRPPRVDGRADAAGGRGRGDGAARGAAAGGARRPRPLLPAGPPALAVRGVRRGGGGGRSRGGAVDRARFRPRGERGGAGAAGADRPPPGGTRWWGVGRRRG